MESEKELLDDIFRGSRDAMHRLYERYVGHAMAVALRYVPLREDAEDVVQDSFIKVFAAIPNFQFRGEGSLKGVYAFWGKTAFSVKSATTPLFVEKCLYRLSINGGKC